MDLRIGSSVRSHLVPNRVPRAADFAALPPPPVHNLGAQVILFIGHLGYTPNVLAVNRLARNILPLIRKNLPGARPLIAGRSPTSSITRLAETHAFDLIADPPDVAEHLAKAQIVIVPLEVGGGTRLKILEAMAAGVPVVATSLAAEGLEISDGVFMWSSQTPISSWQAGWNCCARTPGAGSGSAKVPGDWQWRSMALRPSLMYYARLWIWIYR